MLAMHYAHRLPADYDMTLIRRRAAARGPLWEGLEGLAFKAFVAQERGRNGAIGHRYASVYLWLDATAAARFLLGERFQSVIDSFGRPQVETGLPLAARAGAGARETARSLQREDIAVDAAADRLALAAAEQARNRQLAGRPDVIAAWSVLDPATWRLARFTLSSTPAGEIDQPDVLDVLYLARPGLARLAEIAA